MFCDVTPVSRRRRVRLLGTLSNDDGNARENVIEIVYFGSFILLRNYSNACKLSDVAKLSGS